MLRFRNRRWPAIFSWDCVSCTQCGLKRWSWVRNVLTIFLPCGGNGPSLCGFGDLNVLTVVTMLVSLTAVVIVLMLVLRRLVMSFVWTVWTWVWLLVARVSRVMLVLALKFTDWWLTPSDFMCSTMLLTTSIPVRMQTVLLVLPKGVSS